MSSICTSEVRQYLIILNIKTLSIIAPLIAVDQKVILIRKLICICLIIAMLMCQNLWHEMSKVHIAQQVSFFHYLI